MQSIVYGFDFGTSNSAISVLDNDKVSVLPIGTDRELLVRSVMFFPEKTQTCFIGCDAIREYIASGMRGRFISSFKSMLPVSSFVGTTIHGKWFSLEQLIGSFLSTMKTKADSLLGEDVRSVVIGRPAVFSKNQSEEQLAVARLTEAAQIAGFEKIHFQLEPVAAALSYEATLEKEECVFVADLGGGTSDFTAMQLSPEKRYSTDRKCDILTTGGVSIGGDTFSSQIMQHKLATICENVDQTLEQAGIDASLISTVFLTGGTSKTPIILQEFSKRFRASRIQINDVFTSVVTGLARSISLFEW